MGGFVVEPLIMGGPDEPMGGALPAFILQEIAPKTATRFVWTPTTSYARALKSLQDGTTDILLIYGTLNAQPEGVERFSWHFIETTPTLAVQPSSPLQKLNKPEDLAGMDIAWALGTPLPPELANIPIKWDWTSGHNWQAMNLRKLGKGRIQGAYFNNEFSPSYVARKEKIEIRLLPLPLKKRPFVMFYSLKADLNLVKEFERLARQAFSGDKFRRFLEDYID